MRRPRLRSARRAAIVALAAALALTAGAPLARAVVPPPPEGRGGPREDFDVRDLVALGREAPPTASQKLALERLRRELAHVPGGEVVVRWGPHPGTLHHLFRTSGWLSAPDGRDAEVVARAFLARHREVLGLGAGDVKSLRLDKRATDPGSRATHLWLSQVVDGVTVYHGEVRVHLDRHGRILSVGGNTAPARVASDARRLDAPAAVSAAARSLGADVPRLAPTARDGAIVRFEKGPLAEAPWASEAWVPFADGLVRAWVVVLGVPGDPGWYQLVVDAGSGRVLQRLDLVDHAATEGLVFREDPGQGPQVVVPFVDDEVELDPASPFGWSAAGATQGNNCDVKDDRAADDEDTIGARAAGTGAAPLAFAYPFTDSPADDLAASCTNLFYLNNWLHDRLVRLGFDEASGNFQEVNVTGLGRGGDAVRVDAQDGSGTNNANFRTPPDGSPPRMQMYVWTYTTPGRDSGFDASIVTHELFHGVSHRLVGLFANHAGCLGGRQGGAMGEAWSDYFACSFWDQPTVGGYVVNDYAEGIRREPYDAYPYGYGELCNMGGFQVHRDGEIWAATLWEIRRLFMARYGHQRGRCVVDRLVLDGMKLSPCYPSFVDMRDAILLAARLHGADGDECLLWQGFASRGLGVGAVTQPECTSAADASTAVPPECAACAAPQPATGLVLDVTQPNRVVARFTPAPGAAEHVLLRSSDPCPGECLEAAFEEVARGPGDATALEDVDRGDHRVSVGDRFAYRVVAGTGACTASTPCLEATVTGRCTLPPEAAGDDPLGVAALLRPWSATCGLRVQWSPARASCGAPGSIRYNVYRSMDPAFVPAPATLVASVRAPATEWLDTTPPPAAVTYVVRAEDLTAGGPGPHGGNEEANDTRLTIEPVGPPSGTGTFSDDAESGERPGYLRTGTFMPNDWAIVSDANTRGGSAWHVSDVEGGNADKNLHLPPLSLGSAPRLSFQHAFWVEDGFDGCVIEISVDGGRTWTDLADDIVVGGYESSRGAGRTLTVADMIHPPNTNRLWTGQNASGFPAYDRVEVDLVPYAGARDAQIRFRMLVDPLATQPGGWYVDDVLVEDVVVNGPCAWGCTAPPRAFAPDVAGCTSPTEPREVIVDASGSTPGPAGWAAELPIVLTVVDEGSFSGSPWAPGPVATLTFPPGARTGVHLVRVTARGADGCADEQLALVTLADEGPVPPPLGDSLRVTKSAAGHELTWVPVGAGAHNVHVAAPGDDLARLERLPIVATVPGAAASLDPADAVPGGLAFIQVFSATTCGRSVR